jgi:hypothetical protein
MAVFVFPPSPVSITQSPILFSKDGVDTQVSLDTVVPVNSNGLPVEVLNFPATQPISGSVSVSNFPATQPISAASLPLPSGAATEAKQDTGNSSLSSIDGKLTTLNSKDFATSAKQDTGNTSLSNIDGKLQVNGVADLNNTTTTLLGISGNFTGVWTDITKYNSIVVGLKSDVASATDGLRFEYSHDGISVDHAHVYTYSAADGIDYHFGAGFKYIRVNYTNGAVAQTVFNITTTLKSSAMFPSSYRIAQTLTDQFSALITKGVIVGKSSAGGGTFVDVKVNPSGALTTEVSGSVSVSNFPATQPVSGSVSVSNFPATQAVTGTVDVGTLPSIPAGANLIGKAQITDTTGTNILALTAIGEQLTRIRDALGNELLLTSNQEAQVKDVGLPASLGQKTMANSTSVTIASDQGAIPISGTISAVTGALTASYQEVTNLTTVAQTVTPPASAKWVKIYADNLNSNNIRVRLAGTATATSGISFEPGRSEDFSVVGTGISIIAEGGTNQVINFTFGA